MPKLIIMVIILLNCYQQVKCTSLFDFVYDKMTVIKDVFIDAFKAIKSRLRETVFTTPESSNQGTSMADHNQNISAVDRNGQLTVLQGGGTDNNHMFSISAHDLTTPQLAATHGRIIETHVVYTVDGYILTLHRLQYSQPKKTGNQQIRRTILLHHGLLGSSADWILLGPKKSLPYILSDAGHDVWLANSRGNYYSRAHMTMDCNTDEYWDFTWQDIGERDLPATLDYIRKTKNSSEPIDCIGHSMGATAFLVLLSVEHSYNSYCRIAFLLAPLAFMAHTQGPLQILAAMDGVERRMLLGRKEFMPTRRTSLTMTFKMCNDQEIYCRNPLFFLTGSPLQEGTRTPEFTDLLQQYIPAGGSSNTIVHYLELIGNKQFHKYGKRDWKFKLKYISTPILILSSNEDIISNATDNQMLYLSILNPVGHIIIKDQNVSHTEFAWGFNTDVLIYYKIRDLIDMGPDVNRV